MKRITRPPTASPFSVLRDALGALAGVGYFGAAIYLLAALIEA